MYALFMLYLNLLIVSIMSSCILQMDKQVQSRTAELDALNVELTSAAFRQRMLRTGNFGTITLADIKSQDEGFPVRGVNLRLQLQSANNVSDGTWRFDRVLVYAVSPDNFDFDPIPASANKCDTTASFLSAPSWCGPDTGIVYQLIETREHYLSMLTDEALRMQSTLQKLARGYNVVENESFPHGSLAVGTAANLCAIGGVTCIKSNCSSVIMLDQTPLDCVDQYSRWGQPVALNFITPKHIALSVQANGIRRTNSTTRNIARELRVP